MTTTYSSWNFKLSKVALLTLEGSGMIGIPGVSAKLFQCLSQEKKLMLF